MAHTPADLYDEQIELINGRKTLLFTWNPRPRFYNYNVHDENDYNLQWITMCDKIIGLERCSDTYSIIAEISDQGKLHCHGFIVLTDKIKWHKKVLPTFKNNGFVKLNKATSTNKKTFVYHYKHMDSTQEYIDRYPIIITPSTIGSVKKHLRTIKIEALHKTYKEIKRIDKPRNQNIELMFERHFNNK